VVGILKVFTILIFKIVGSKRLGNRTKHLLAPSLVFFTSDLLTSEIKLVKNTNLGEGG
jgi:hypothetical protein